MASLADYLDRYGKQLGEQASRALRPLHTPGVNPIIEPALLREPYEVQSHCITACIRALERQNGVHISGECGTGKAQPHSAKVLTPDGWKLMGDVAVGDTVIDPDGGTATIQGVYPQGIKEVFRVTFTDGSQTECCDEHLWNVTTPERKARGHQPEVLELRELVRRGLIANRREPQDNGQTARYFIPLTKPVEFNSPECHEIDPYLLGLLIGDGCLRWQASFSTADEELLESVRATLPAGMTAKHHSKYDYSLLDGGKGTHNRLRVSLARMGLWRKLSQHKFIPAQYKRASVAVRLAVLQGLLDTDGSATKTYAEFGTSSQQLAEDVLDIVQSLGGVAKLSIKETTHLPCFRLFIRLPPGLSPFRMARKANKYKGGGRVHRAIRSVESIGTAECQCIAVGSKRNLYITDNYIVTHNTLMAQAVAQGHSRGGYRAIVLCPPHLTGKWEREIVATVKNAHVHHIESYKDMLRVQKDAPPFGRGWWIVSSTVAKMGPGWRAAFNTKRQKGKLGIAYCPKCDAPQTRIVKDKEELIPLTAFFKQGKKEPKKHYCCSCEEPLWQWLHKPNKWPVATYIHKHLPGWFQYFIADEAHQSKSDTSAIGQAVGSLSAACDYTIAMSGTMVGGYAWHVRPLLFRIAPGSLVADGLGWNDKTEFDERYGRIEKRIVESESEGSGNCNKQSRGRSTKTSKHVVPGVMPGLFGKHLIQNTVFLSLEDMVENLPMLTEKVIPIAMDLELEEAYKLVEVRLRSACRELLRKKDKRLLAQMLTALLGYADHPYGWKEIGYYDFNVETGANVWNSVVTPPTLDKRTRPKEQHVIDTCLAEKALGRQTWVYSTMTDARDVNERLRSLLAGVGLKTEVLRSSVSTGDREDWISEHAPRADVIISHPQLVETGLDLFAKDGSYNFSTLYFYSTGTSTFTQRQAARRSYRLGQNLPCKVFYAAYKDTMQERLLELMAEKQQASELIDGVFSTEGLLALCGDQGSLDIALAKSLVEKIDQGHKWQKVRR